MNASYHERIGLENDLRLAIERSEFKLYFQPQFSVVRKRIVGMEALVRWQHPEHGLLDPCGFIDLAEETGLIRAITDSVLAQACAQLAQWRAWGHSELRMSVNVSPQEFDRGDLVDRITSHVERHRLPPNSLEIEITENLLLQDVSGVIDKMRMLRDRGVRISIDDFGTGYSSLNYLRRFPINAQARPVVRPYPTKTIAIRRSSCHRRHCRRLRAQTAGRGRRNRLPAPHPAGPWLR
jgi:EAL domain-containing protein (putative c-di-GMP-specific phosphodiesterase class I)